jgi:hypothetical protein
MRHFLFLLALAGFAQTTEPGWLYLSTTTGQLAVPNAGAQQTSTAAFDMDANGSIDFVITERTQSPSAVGYRYVPGPKGEANWQRLVIEAEAFRFEAGSTFGDVDGDGDLDFIGGSDGQMNELRWYENPAPNFQPDVPWKRRLIKQQRGRGKHHDQMWADVDSDGRNELIAWNQVGTVLLLARPPANVKSDEQWQLTEIYRWSADSEPEQRATAPAWRRTNEHEGLDFVDIDGDGLRDIVGAGLWFKYRGDGRFQHNTIDAGYAFSRSAAGQLIEGGRPEVLLSPGDGEGPLLLYQWEKGLWKSRPVLAKVENGHSLRILDFNGDGKLDIFLGEMRLRPAYEGARLSVLLGDGAGNFTEQRIATGFDQHESRMVDLNGDGLLDVLGKPYNYQVPALHIWLQKKKP